MSMTVEWDGPVIPEDCSRCGPACCSFVLDRPSSCAGDCDERGQHADPALVDPEPCAMCSGFGGVYAHALSCAFDLCAGNGDQWSCNGVWAPCPACATTSSSDTE